MYNVHVVKRYSVAQVRERLAQALDQAEAGVPVVIERRGVKYRLTVEPGSKGAVRRRGSRIEIVDPAVEAGPWAWTWTGDGLTFEPSDR